MEMIESLLIDSVDTIAMLAILSCIFIAAKFSFQLYSELPCVYEQSERERVVYVRSFRTHQTVISQYSFSMRKHILRLIKQREGPDDEEGGSLFLF
jgi:hypothetical protein